ncbi:SDR family NAD(P)-dependent oxidoreductase [Nocardioides sp. cx-169]|uniref:SDR family NAD(P)-dependent oxidoreductase n=1 Tax=Nocardioides sp. cx-169 TaxID=2899080 RepID=UPI001E5FFBE7|nr:SDR family NAD(P)-dependent oxidoreductase [Nocardioides sp. cx-169]MCD4536526.1 SDR family NAD(P)-dependent oxidoreductase [Nocardioides sp. cx-169]
MSRNWFITGASCGFGRAFARAALERGDRVAATARERHAIDDLATAHPDTLVPLTLDVTDGAAVAAVVRDAENRLGGLDVVVNNAGYGQFGAVEELTDADLHDQLETNVLGPLRVVRAPLPAMRERGHGTPGPGVLHRRHRRVRQPRV